MEQIFVDTSAWSALADEGDIHHEEVLLFKDDIAEKYHLFAQMGFIKQPS
jgi:predicted nucleic acid-binding protein